MSNNAELKAKGKRLVDKNYNDVLHGNITPATFLKLMNDAGKDTENLMATKHIRNFFHHEKQKTASSGEKLAVFTSETR